MKCSYCKSHRGGAYKDWVRGFNFNLCFDCCKELGFFPNCLEVQKKCGACGKHYSPRGTWQKNCTDCWLKGQPKKIDVVFKSLPIQRKLVGVFV